MAASSAAAVVWCRRMSIPCLPPAGLGLVVSGVVAAAAVGLLC